MSGKLGLIGGLGWPATVAYYEAICLAARGRGHKGSPEMTIESLDMSKTLAVRGTSSDERSWHRYDEIFKKAVARLADAGCSHCAIASVTPHNRLRTISEASPIPIISIVDAVSSKLNACSSENAAILGTRVTMEGAVFDEVLSSAGIRTIKPTDPQIAEFTGLLGQYFYTGQGSKGRNALVAFARTLGHDPTNTTFILACTDLAPAFPDMSGQIYFAAAGLNFLDTTAAHIDAILDAVMR